MDGRIKPTVDSAVDAGVDILLWNHPTLLLTPSRVVGKLASGEDVIVLDRTVYCGSVWYQVQSTRPTTRKRFLRKPIVCYLRGWVNEQYLEDLGAETRRHYGCC